MLKLFKTSINTTSQISWSLLLLRVVSGYIILTKHGIGKIMDGPDRWVRLGQSGMGAIGLDSFHTFFGFLAAFSESFCAAFFIMGLFSRSASFLLFMTMFVAALSHLIPGKGNPELALIYGLIFLVLLLAGPGKYSLDHKLFTKSK